MEQYLEHSEWIDWQAPAVVERARALADAGGDVVETARRCFEFVRDEIEHSWDYRRNPVTCRASDVLAHGTGYCYAKSHLLAALLRANGIPAGLCYQRLTIDESGPPHCLHGLNAVWLPDYGWYRLDPRGNRAGIDAAFDPPVEKLAFPVIMPGEADLPEVWAEPLPSVVKVLTRCETWDQVADNLPDMELW
ncbi:MAG: transglutaminase-like domain-containing protein [Pseudomonadota bacterium]